MMIEPGWPTCEFPLEQGECAGVQSSGSTWCLAHLGDEAMLGLLDTLEPGGDIDLRGVTISRVLLDLVLARFSEPRQPRELSIGAADFTGARFSGDARFERILFSGTPKFRHATFAGQVTFERVATPGCADFSDARFEGVFRMSFTDVEADLDFRRARFERKADLEMVRARDLFLDDARCAEWVSMVVEAREISCNGTRFEEGVALSAQYARIAAIRTVFGASSVIGYPAESPFNLWRVPPAWQAEPNVDFTPQLSAMKDTDVGNLVLTDVNLSNCEFAGAHRLDQLRVEGRVRFGVPPGWWRTKRQMLGEEARLRRWNAFPPIWVDALQVAALYRSLRKSFEDSKNEPGAGDFYYGEMEMRRLSSLTRFAERVILTGYWAVSGYGQRAGRALLALLVLVAAVGGGLMLTGLALDDAARVAVGAVVLRDAGTRLTEAGQWIVMGARVLGPVLLALALLALRARVKR